MQPKRPFTKYRKLIERENAVRYMLISLVSFVATVVVVRSFLSFTGYPQIGSGTLHIAHVLWGGLILYIAAILPLIYVNPRLNTIVSILSGVGVGLFIDEIGKFITKQYDYFFPVAAPIMYIFFLLIVILVIIIRRPEKVDGRVELVQGLEMVREQLYRPLGPTEQAILVRDLTSVIEYDQDPVHQQMARHLLDFVKSDTRPVPVTSLSRWLRLIARIKQWLDEPRLRWLLITGQGLLTLLTLKNPAQYWLMKYNPGSRLLAFLNTHAGRQINAVEAPGFYNLRIGVELFVALLLILSTLLLIAARRKMGINLGLLSLMVSLAVLDMFLFYFEQFSTFLETGFQFLVLFGVLYYREEFLNKRNKI